MPELNLPAAAPAAAGTAPAHASNAAPEDVDASAFGSAMARAHARQAANAEPAAGVRGAHANAHKPIAAETKVKPAAERADTKDKDDKTDAEDTPAVSCVPQFALNASAVPATADAASAAVHARTASIDKAAPRVLGERRFDVAADAAPAATASSTAAHPGPQRADAAAAVRRDESRAHSAPAERTAPGATVTANASAPHDRLGEDFQQRFERALATASAAPRIEVLPAHAAAVHTAAVAPAPADTVRIDVPTPIGTAAFAEDFSQRVALVARGKVASAELSLTPADLGPVSVSIEVRGSEATLVFGAAHAATRSAIEDALPRLRDMLHAQGLQLADARVDTQSDPGFARRDSRPAPAASGARARPIDGTSSVAAPAVTRRSTRLIDVIA